ESRYPKATDLVLLTNGRGAMARLRVDFSQVRSKYDCVLGANLHPHLPVDRHVFVKRIRVWANADGFISPLEMRYLVEFQPAPNPIWTFAVPAGGGRLVRIQMTATMIEGQNTVQFRFRQLDETPDSNPIPANLTVRFDIEDRNFHSETRRNGGA